MDSVLAGLRDAAGTRWQFTGGFAGNLHGSRWPLHALDIDVARDGLPCVATATWDQTAWLWDADLGNTVAVLKGHTAPVTSLSFSPDGRRLATASDDGTVRLWIARESPEELEKRRLFWREQQADAAEKAGQWFAAAFHLGRLLDETPANAALYARRCHAEVHLVRWQHAAADFRQALMRWPTDDAAK